MSSRALVVKQTRKRRNGGRSKSGSRFLSAASSPFSLGSGLGPLIKTTGIPNRFRCQMSYNEQFTAAPASGSSDGYVFNLQSPYDPRFASGGHQPQFFDQVMAIWTYFVVRRVRIRVTVAPDDNPLTSGTSASAVVYQGAAIIAPFTNTSGTRPSAAATDMLEWPGAVTRPIVTQGAPATVSLEIDLVKFLGIPWPIYKAMPLFWGTNGGNPSTMIGYAFVGAIAQGAGAPPPLLCQATIEYDCEVFTPQTLATS